MLDIDVEYGEEVKERILKMLEDILINICLFSIRNSLLHKVPLFILN